MDNYRTTQKMTAFMFVILVIGFASLNIYTRKAEWLNGLTAVEPPASASGAKKTFAAVEKLIGDNIWERMKFIEGYAYLQVLLGKEENGGFDLVKSRSGSMVFGNLYQEISTGIANEAAMRIYRLKKAVAPSGARVIFLGVMPEYVRGFSKFSVGLPAFDLNFDLDALLYFLQSYGIDYLDSRSILARSSLPSEEYMFRADHHWTTEACFEFFRALVTKLDEEYGENLDHFGFYRDIENYHTRYYPKSFLGSFGRKGGAVFSNLDNFTLIWPAFKTDFHFEAMFRQVGPKNVSKDGAAEDSLLQRNVLTLSNIYERDMFATYIGLSSRLKIINHLKPDGLKLFMVMDSFSLPLIFFLAPLFGEIHAIWPLAEIDKENTESIDQYVMNNTFDYIFVEIAPVNLRNLEGFDFFKSPQKE